MQQCCPAQTNGPTAGSNTYEEAEKAAAEPAKATMAAAENFILSFLYPTRMWVQGFARWFCCPELLHWRQSTSVEHVLPLKLFFDSKSGLTHIIFEIKYLIWNKNCDNSQILHTFRIQIFCRIVRCLDKRSSLATQIEKRRHGTDPG